MAARVSLPSPPTRLHAAYPPGFRAVMYALVPSPEMVVRLMCVLAEIEVIAVGGEEGAGHFLVVAVSGLAQTEERTESGARSGGAVGAHAGIQRKRADRPLFGVQ